MVLKRMTLEVIGDLTKISDQTNTIEGKAAMPEQWTDTSLLLCNADYAVQRCSADAAMHNTVQCSSYALLWFHEPSSTCFTSLILLHTSVTQKKHYTGLGLLQKVSHS